MPELDLKWAVASYQGSKYRTSLVQYYKYYDGDHRFAYATEKFQNTFGKLFREFSDNLCPAVVDSLTERLKITGWRSTEATTQIEKVPAPDKLPGLASYEKVTVDDPIGDAAWELWNDNEMNSRVNEIHREAIKCGDAYLLIWPDEELNAQMWPQTAMEMSVQYDPNKLGVLARASKIWYLPELKKYRLNVYLPDQIEKYITANENPNGVPSSYTAWIPFTDPDTGGPTVVNPYGRVPVFHFANRACYRTGESDLDDVIPIQDALNKSIIDMMIAMEFASYKQRYIIGLEPEIDENTGEPVDRNAKEYGVDRMMAIPGAKDEVAVGQFDATDLGQFRQVADDFRKEVSRISGRPLHYFFITTGDFPSGEAIKSAEARFSGLIQGRQEDWNPVWSEAMKFALSIEQSVADDTEINPLWSPSVPRSEAELADSAIKKKNIGVSRSQLLKELGYDDETIIRMLQETDAHDQMQAVLAAEARGPDQATATSTNGSGGGTTAAKQGAQQAQREGRVQGVRS